MFIVDRPVVLQSVYQLLNSLSDRKILTWDFFLSRFDTLFIEAQVNLEKNGDLAYLRDLRNSENGSEILTTKISKAREALSQSSESSGSRKMIKTLSASFGKWQYKRTMSAPANITPRQESKIGKKFNLFKIRLSYLGNISYRKRKNLQPTNFRSFAKTQNFSLWIGSVFIWKF
jgi:hypothetical protein